MISKNQSAEALIINEKALRLSKRRLATLQHGSQVIILPTNIWYSKSIDEFKNKFDDYNKDITLLS